METNVRYIFLKIGVSVENRDIQDCHRVTVESRTMVKLSDRRDCSQILSVKRELMNLVPTEMDFPTDTAIFINEILCPYYDDL